MAGAAGYQRPCEGPPVITGVARLFEFWGLMAVFWLLRLLPGHPGQHRNPPGSMERQADHVLGLLRPS